MIVDNSHHDPQSEMGLSLTKANSQKTSVFRAHVLVFRVIGLEVRSSVPLRAARLEKSPKQKGRASGRAGSIAGSDQTSKAAWGA